MVLLLIIFGVALAIVGLSSFIKRRKTIGGVLLLAGSALIVTGVVALLNFHP